MNLLPLSAINNDFSIQFFFSLVNSAVLFFLKFIRVCFGLTYVIETLQRHNLQESTDLTRCRGRTCSARKVGVTLSVRIRIAGQVYLADKFTGSLIILLRTWNQAIFTVSRKSLPNSYLSMRGVPLRPYWALD